MSRHDIPEQADRKGQCPRDLRDQVQRKEERILLEIAFDVIPGSLGANAGNRDCEKDDCRQGRRRRQVGRGWVNPRQLTRDVAARNEEKKRPGAAGDLFYLFVERFDDPRRQHGKPMLRRSADDDGHRCRGQPTLGELRAALEGELVELEEALEELDLLIDEQGSDAKAILLDLEPATQFAKIREKCLQACRTQP